MKSLNNSYSHSYTEIVGIPYYRWSTAIQGKGDSLRRQSAKAEEWSKKTGIPLANEALIDAGVSAFKGKNLKDGALGAFLTAAQEGQFVRGSYLLIESIDRLSRQGMFATAAIVRDIWSTGIGIVTLADGKAYEPDCNDMDALWIVLVAMRAKEESATKQFRTKDSYAKRYADAKKTHVLPVQSLMGWLTKDPETGLAVFASERKRTIVERICDMSLSGCGYPKIAKTLNQAGEAPFTMEKRKNAAHHWTVAALENILKSPALYGDYHMKDGTIIEGAFPAVITKDEFNRIQAGMASRLKVGRGRKGETYSNLFGGIAKCHQCGGAMTIRQPKPGRATTFYCRAMLVGNCHARPWNYDIFEKAFLSFVNEIDLEKIIHGGSGSRIEEITNTIQTLEGERANVQKNIQTFIGMIRKNHTLSKSIQPEIDEDQAKLDAIDEQMKVLEKERNTIRAGHRATKEMNLVDFPKVGTGPGEVTVEKLYELRAKAAQHIRTIVEQVSLKRDDTSKFGAQFWVHFKGGDVRIVHVDYTNPRKPFAVTHAYGGKDIIPDDLETATELRNYILAETISEVDWLIENGGEAGLDAAREVIEKMKCTKATMERQVREARELGLIKP